jgi:hypothetical protein
MNPLATSESAHPAADLDAQVRSLGDRIARKS